MFHIDEGDTLLTRTDAFAILPTGMREGDSAQL